MSAPPSAVTYTAPSAITMRTEKAVTGAGRARGMSSAWPPLPSTIEAPSRASAAPSSDS